MRAPAKKRAATGFFDKWKKLSWGARLSIWATLLTAALGLVVTVVTWCFPKQSEAGPGTAVPEVVDPSPAEPVNQAGLGKGSSSNITEGSAPAALPPRQPPTKPERRPVELVLKSGEQRVILNGRVGLAVEQTMVGEMPVLTLRISPSGAPTQNHAVLGGGTRVEFQAAGRGYVVSVLSWDPSSRQAVLRVDQTS